MNITLKITKNEPAELTLPALYKSTQTGEIVLFFTEHAGVRLSTGTSENLVTVHHPTFYDNYSSCRNSFCWEKKEICTSSPIDSWGL